ncbi:hypothetical protein HerbRD11066_25750 [Herbidospora sp. RD11066]
MQINPRGGELSPPRGLLDRITGLIKRLSDNLYAEPDAFAFVVGWEIERKWNRRTYRDPRFNELRANRSAASPGSRR